MSLNTSECNVPAEKLENNIKNAPINSTRSMDTSKNFLGFLLIFLGQSISLLGSSIVQFAIIWYLTEKTGSALILSIATFAGILPMIIIGPFAGVIADRVNRKALIITTDFMTMLATMGLILLFFLNIVEVWHIIVLLAIRGVSQGFQLPAVITLPKLLVPEKRLQFVNALNSFVNSLIFISSPAIGAYLIQISSIGNILWLDVITFIPGTIFLLLVPIFIPEELKKHAQTELSFRRDFRTVGTYLKANLLLPILFLIAMINIFINPIASLLPLMILKYHGGGAFEYGNVQITFQVGMFLGSLLLMIFKDHIPKFREMYIWMFVLPGTFLIFGLIPVGLFWSLYLLGSLLGFSISMVDIQLISLFQRIIPVELQGRVFSIIFTLIKSLLPLALLLWGFIAELIGVKAVFILSASLCLIITFLIIQLSHLWNIDRKFLQKEEDSSISNENSDEKK